MGFWATKWAVDVETGKPGAKCILLVLASYADGKGHCWPSQETIALQAEMSVDTVQRRLKELEIAGLIERERRHGLRGERISDLYILSMPAEPQNNSGSSLGRTENAPNRQMCGLHIDEWSEEWSIKQRRREQAIETKASKGKRMTILSRREDNAQSKWGEVELQIAERIGVSGWEILMELPPSEVEHLIVRQNRGTLDERTINRLRSGLPP